MSNPLTEARQHVAGALAPLGYRVYAYGHEAPATPCFMIGYANPWMQRMRLSGQAADVVLTIHVIAPQVQGNEAAASMVEDMIWKAGTVLPINGEVQAPRSGTVNNIEVLEADLTVVVHVKE